MSQTIKVVIHLNFLVKSINIARTIIFEIIWKKLKEDYPIL